MLSMLMILNCITSVIFCFLNHPLSLGYSLFLQTIFITLMINFIYFNSWFSYILFLIMISGMMIMFIYMTSIASNEKFKIPSKMFISFLIILFLFMILHFSIYYFNFKIFNLNWEMYDNLNLSKIFNYPNSLILIMLMIYLFITLIAIVKITMKTTGPLRQK